MEGIDLLTRAATARPSGTRSARAAIVKAIAQKIDAHADKGETIGICFEVSLFHGKVNEKVRVSLVSSISTRHDEP